MAGNTRGKLKEKFESVHRNFDWCTKHLTEALFLIENHNPNLTEGIKALAKGVKVLDNLAQDVYSRL